MKMKIAPIAVLAIAFVSAVMISPIHASYAPIVYAWTDKPSYLPGDAGVLHITVRNQGTQAFTVKNITVAYPWKSFIIDHWDGNFTTAGINQAIATPRYRSASGRTSGQQGLTYPAQPSSLWQQQHTSPSR